MLIRVRYNDGSFGTVDDSILEALIAEDRIVEFRRTSGWVRIGRDPVRNQVVERRRRGSILNIYV
jgi:hypothetical protein